MNKGRLHTVLFLKCCIKKLLSAFHKRGTVTDFAQVLKETLFIGMQFELFSAHIKNKKLTSTFKPPLSLFFYCFTLEQKPLKDLFTTILLTLFVPISCGSNGENAKNYSSEELDTLFDSRHSKSIIRFMFSFLKNRR